MLEIKVENGSCACKMKGSFVDIASNYMTAVRSIYNSFAKSDKDFAEQFKRIATDGDFMGNCFKDEKELEAEVKAQKKSNKDDFFEALDDLLEVLKYIAEEE